MPEGGAPGDPSNRRITLPLSPEQRELIAATTGIQLASLGYTVAEAVGVAMLAAAVDGGHDSPATRRLIGFDLTPDQAAALSERIGGPRPTRWVVDADRTQVRYGEDWSLPEPVPLGTRGLAVPATAPEPAGDLLVVRLPPVADDVFGTGRHPATRLAAALLEEILRPGDEVIDVGTGSGVLAIYAVRLGAARVRAVDTSPAAVAAARHAVGLNSCGDRVDVVLGELDAGGPPADLVVANILAGVLLDLLPVLAWRVRPGGRLLTSGVVDARAPEITAAASAAGFRHLASSSSAGWTASAFRHAGGARK